MLFWDHTLCRPVLCIMVDWWILSFLLLKQKSMALAKSRLLVWFPEKASTDQMYLECSVSPFDKKSCVNLNVTNLWSELYTLTACVYTAFFFILVVLWFNKLGMVFCNCNKLKFPLEFTDWLLFWITSSLPQTFLQVYKELSIVEVLPTNDCVALLIHRGQFQRYLCPIWHYFPLLCNKGYEY